MKKIRWLLVLEAFLLLIHMMHCTGLAAGDGGMILVCLGDSYSSGEGIEPFFGQDAPAEEKINDPDWLAHRSENAWSGMLRLPGYDGPMSEHGDRWYFVAASGARAGHLLGEQTVHYHVNDREDTVSLPPQLDVFQTIEGSADYVTVTIGGNDAGFEEVLTEAFLENVDFLNPHSLQDKIEEIWKAFDSEGGIRDKLRKAYHDIADAAGPDAAILVVGYPRLLNENGAFTVSPENAAYLNQNISEFNDRIEQIVDECAAEGMNIYFVSVEDVFEGHEAYTSFPYINDIIFLPKSEDIDHTATVSAYSMHPNQNGASAYAEAVQRKIDQLEQEKSENAETEPPDETPAADPDFSIVGTWKSVGEYGFGQAQPGSTVIFDGTYCNFYSPKDTYQFYLLNDQWTLQTKNVLWGDVLTFRVEIVDENNIRVIYGSGSVTELTRVSSADSSSPPPQSETAPAEGGSLSGTYVSSFYGFVNNTFTFYDGNRVSMDALGIVGDGTYEIRNGVIIITYTSNISDEICVWSAAFEDHGDTLYINGDAFVRQ